MLVTGVSVNFLTRDDRVGAMDVLGTPSQTVTLLIAMCI